MAALRRTGDVWHRLLSVPLARSERDVAQEHRDIADAVIARDVARACAAIASHM
ncbi:MAG: FCD domain-containing protein [Mesorhizobium sp.]|nr:MAG: FCD domain-containing protein [Mesorhizobium sp.]TIO59701.1 MAG: FCD domain-containing protein [Mesorhizobium sp.]TJV65475.1 MAG: FCD domain-containing protein [Mesorhizobium sp.]